MLNRILSLAFAASLSCSSGLALAEDGHGLSSMKGDLGIELKVSDHAMAGAVKDFVIWGSVNEKEGSSELIMRRFGQDIKSVFKKGEKSFGGVVSSSSGQGLRTTSIQFESLDRQKNEYRFSVNNSPVTAIVTSEDFQNNHFIKPTYTVNSGHGQIYSFKFEGQACYKYSLHILTMMIAALSH